MPLYLDEIYFNDAKKAHATLSGAVKDGFPQGVTLKAGPWFSNEECKVVLVLDIQDHSLTFGPFTGAMANAGVTKRRLTPIVDWETAGKVLNG